MNEKNTWRFYIFIALPFIALFVIAITTHFLECSEYESFKSTQCKYWEQMLGLDLYWTTSIAFICMAAMSIPALIISLGALSGAIIELIKHKVNRH